MVIKIKSQISPLNLMDLNMAIMGTNASSNLNHLLKKPMKNANNKFKRFISKNNQAIPIILCLNDKYQMET